MPSSQLVEHYTGIVEVVGSNPEFFSGFIYCLSRVYYCKDHPHSFNIFYSGRSLRLKWKNCELRKDGEWWNCVLKSNTLKTSVILTQEWISPVFSILGGLHLWLDLCWLLLVYLWWVFPFQFNSKLQSYQGMLLSHLAAWAFFCTTFRWSVLSGF